MNHSHHSHLFACLSLVALTACAGDDFSSIPGQPSNPSAGQAGGGASQQAGTGGQAGTGIGGRGGQAGTTSGGTGGSIGGSSGSCMEGTYECKGDILLGCSPIKQKYEVLTTCNAGKCDASKGNCIKDCQSGDVRCQGDELQTCVDGSYQTKEKCDEGLCSEKQKSCLSCKEGEARACAPSGTGQLVCDSKGIPTKEQPCPTTKKYCVDDGECVQCRTQSDCPSISDDPCFVYACPAHACTLSAIPAGQSASTNDPDACVSKSCDSNGKVLDKNLEAGVPCKQAGKPGICNGQGLCGVCKPGALECLSGGSMRLCNDEGQWETEAPCTTGKPVCDDNQCLGVIDVSVGEKTACAVIENGSVWCWGDNEYGNVILDTSMPFYRSPKKISNLPAMKTVSVGHGHACGLGKLTSNVVCWGNNSSGQLGTGDTKADNVPHELTKLGAFKSVKSGFYHTCGIADDSSLWCWGNNYYGQVNPQQKEESIIHPQKIDHVTDSPSGQTTAINNPAFIMAGTSHTCIQQYPNAVCWGSNERSQISRTKDQGSFHVANPDGGWFEGSYDFVGLAGYGNTTGILFVDDTFHFESYGAIGDVSFTDNGQGKEFSLFSVSSDRKVRITQYACFEILSDHLKVHGINHAGVMGDGGSSYQQHESMLNLKNIADISSNGETACAWKNSGEVWCWGKNENGYTGTNSYEFSVDFPTLVAW